MQNVKRKFVMALNNTRNWIQAKKESSNQLMVMLIIIAIAAGVAGLLYIFVKSTLLHEFQSKVSELLNNWFNHALVSSVLGSLVADDKYYFVTYETVGTPVMCFRDADESFDIFSDCMYEDVNEAMDYYYNFSLDCFICYEVEGSAVGVTAYSENGGTKSVSTGRLGSVRTPTDAVVREKSVYGKVRFDIKSILDRSFITKTKDIYYTLEIND